MLDLGKGPAAPQHVERSCQAIDGIDVGAEMAPKYARRKRGRDTAQLAKVRLRVIGAAQKERLFAIPGRSEASQVVRRGQTAEQAVLLARLHREGGWTRFADATTASRLTLMSCPLSDIAAC